MVDALTQWLETLNPQVVQFINFVLLIIEGIGVPAVPYEASMLALGLMIENGQTTIWESVLYGTVGNTIGNVIGYYIGPRGLRMISQKTQKRLGLLQIQNLLERYGPWMAVISRWFGPLRTLFILYARTAGLKPLAYAACSFVGALTWTAVWQIGMWLGGKALVEVWHRYQFYGVGVLVLIGVPVYLILRRRRIRREALQDAEQTPDLNGPVRE